MGAKRTDANQSSMVQQLRQCGVKVIHLHTVGKGVPDLLCCAYRRTTGQRELLLVEVKTDKGKLTKDQVTWHQEFTEDGTIDVPMLVATGIEDVLAWFGLV